MSQSVVIVNRAAGGGRGPALAAPHLAHLDATVRYTERPGHARELAEQAARDGASTVVAAGGDGTVFEVVNGLMQLAPDDRPTLGLLPVGTGNSFVRDLALDSPARAVEAILGGHTQPVDVVRLDHDEGVLHYVNLLSVGFSAEAGALTNRRYKGLGASGYILAVLQCLLRLGAHPFPHALDGGPVDARPYVLVSFSNSRFTGGDMQMAPRADISDGELDVVTIGPMRRLRFLRAFPRIFAGTHDQLPEIDLARAREVVFSAASPVDVMVDGEVLTLTLRKLEVLPGALRVLR